jgi:DNA gyrase subunit A
MNNKDSFLVFLTKNGLIKKTSLELFSNIRTTGLVATAIRENDELISVKHINSSKEMQDLFIITKNGLAVRYDHNTLPSIKRDTYGRLAMSIGKNDCISSMDIISDTNDLVFIATDNGLGKSIKVDDIVKRKDPNTKKMVDINDGFPRLKEMASTKKGRIAIKLNQNDKVASTKIINNDAEKIVVITNNKILTTSVDEFNKPIKRNTKGMKLINLSDDDKVLKVVLD